MNELPPRIDGPSAWYGPDLAAGADWIETLSPAELSEIEFAGRRLAELEVDWQSLRCDDFPLPNLRERLARILEQVLEERGFALLRGLPVERFGHRLSAISFLGLGLHWGNLRSQNRHGHLLGHVKDAGLSSQDPNVRVYQTRERQNFHTDSCDVVGLLCLHPARSGGLSSLVSSVTIFNEMRERRPDLARVLFEPIETDRRGEIPAGQKPFFCIPVFNCYGGLLSTIYNRTYIASARRLPEVPPLALPEAGSGGSTYLRTWRTTRACIWIWSCERETSSLCIITRCCTTALHSRIGPSRGGSGTCCDSGWRRKGLGRFRRYSRNGTGRLFLASAGASWCLGRGI